MREQEERRNCVDVPVIRNIDAGKPILAYEYNGRDLCVKRYC